jgi:hypothetical protein
MTHRAFLLAIVVACACCEMALGDPPATQRATVVDSSGTKTEVTNLDFVSDDYYSHIQGFDLASSTARISVETKTFKIAVPLASLISIEAKGKEIEVKYLWMGKEQTVEGSLASGDFMGKTDVGGFKLASGKLKQLKLKPGPAPVRDESTSPPDTTLVLLDGAKVRVGHLKRQYEYDYNDTFYVNGKRGTSYSFYDDFRFLRGDALTTIEFKSLSSIEFGEKHRVTVTLKNGTKTAGTLMDIADDLSGGGERGGMTHISGIGESGVFLISPTLVKAIQFDLTSSTDSK